MMRAIGGALAIMVAFLATTAWAQSQAPRTLPLPLPLPFPNFQGTPEEQAACRPDVDRFCRDAVPDTFRVLACLQSERTRISAPCRRVLESHGQ
jgi:hypothetical protein